MVHWPELHSPEIVFDRVRVGGPSQSCPLFILPELVDLNLSFFISSFLHSLLTSLLNALL